MSKRRFELVDSTSNKFWEISLVGSEVQTAYGKMGTSGQTTTKDEGTPEAARRLFEKLVREKTKKGYLEVSAPSSPSAAARPASGWPMLDVFARLAELAAVDGVDEDGEELLGLADLEVLATAEQRAAIDLSAMGLDAPSHTLVPLVLHGSGSLVVGWKPDASSTMLAVWIDSEGDPRAVFASSMEQMFALLPHGLGYLYDCIMHATRGAVHTRTSDCFIGAWTTAGFPPHPSPAAAVRDAHQASPRFEDWLAGASGTTRPETTEADVGAPPRQEELAGETGGPGEPSDAIEVRIARGVDDLDDEAKRDLTYDLCETTSFADPAVAARAFRWALDYRLNTDDVDGDTITYFLIRMLELTPSDDALLMEYLRAVADSDYAYTDRTLGDVAEESGMPPERAKRFALAHTFAEGWCVAMSRTEPPSSSVAAALRRAFALACKYGATHADWRAMRADLIARGIAHETRPAEGEFERWALG